MLLKQPRSFRWKRAFKQKIMCTTKTKKLTSPHFGFFGIKVLETGKLQYHQIESIRRILIRFCKKSSKLWFHPIFSVSLTKKPSEVRMGKGKGKFDRWVANVIAGQILIELENVSPLKAGILFKKICNKSPIKLCFLRRIL